MNNRSCPHEEIQATEVETIIAEVGLQSTQSELRSSEEAYRQTIVGTKVPSHGDLRVETKSDDELRFFLHNINGMTYWKKGNYKPEWLLSNNAIST